uniref:Uncharacterized protein n=2 Tax=Aegilops tauschii subsp. strangulata TaxID=200361 RepID=A0A453KBG5_AEGTS
MDPQLNETGRQQAVVVARRLSGEAKPAAVYTPPTSSVLPRPHKP